MLDGRRHFSITFTSPLQLILGTNGSGKSSLLEELTPLPAQAPMYLPDGRKIIRILAHDKIYTLKSEFLPKQRHSFLVGDEEFNKGGTITVQRELVKEHFRITPDVHELLIGRDSFDRMSSARRKEWFIRLCDTDYTYAIKAYTVMREKHRDTAGALRVAKRQLIHEAEKLIDSTEEARLRHETHELHEQLSALLEFRKPVEQDPETLRLAQEQLDAQLFKLGNQLTGLLAQHGARIRDGQHWAEQVILHETNALKARTLIEQHTSVFLKNQAKIQVLEQAEAQTIEQLKALTTALSEKYQARIERLLVPTLTIAASPVLSTFQSLKLTLNEIFSELPENKLKRFNHDALRTAREDLSALNVKKTDTVAQLQRVLAKVQHLREHRDSPGLQCPSCAHKFSLHFSQDGYESAQTKVRELEERLSKEINPTLEVLQAFIDECVAYGQRYRQFTQCMAACPVLRPYWDYLLGQEVVSIAPKEVLHHLDRIEQDLHVQLDAQAILAQYEDKRALLASLQAVGGEDLQALQLSNQELNASISEHTDALQAALTLKALAQQARQRCLDIAQLSASARQTIQKKRSLNKAEIESLRRIHLNQLIREMQSALAAREHTLNNLTLQKRVVETMGAQIAHLTKLELAQGMVMRQLSPTEGLIAEGLLGFMRNFVHQMNDVIEKVWTYPLVVQTCALTEGEAVDLDYKFPMRVNDADYCVPDVALGSRGQQEIINRAFIQTAVQYLHLADAPVLLDEFASAMDAAHKASSVYMIKSLLEQSTTAQVFLISHDIVQYGALANAQICVLNDLNIVVPKMASPINAHVERF